jgi:hypothetical protein
MTPPCRSVGDFAAVKRLSVKRSFALRPFRARRADTRAHRKRSPYADGVTALGQLVSCSVLSRPSPSGGKELTLSRPLAQGTMNDSSAPMAVVHRRDASSRKRMLIVLATHTGRLFRYKVELVAFGISASTLERNSLRIGEVFALL